MSWRQVAKQCVGCWLFIDANEFGFVFSPVWVREQKVDWVHLGLVFDVFHRGEKSVAITIVFAKDLLY